MTNSIDQGDVKLAVPINWQEDLLPVLKRNKQFISEVYGKLPFDFVGGGRPSYSSLPINSKRALGYINKINKLGLKFNYLLNSNCLNNFEWTRQGQARLTKLVDWLLQAKVDSVTVAIPYLAEFIKNRYPQIKIMVSTAACVDSVDRAKFWQNLGVEKITLRSIDVNRDFELLKQIRKNIKCKLQLIVNLNCLYNCAAHMYHAALISHGSQCKNNFMIDFPYLSCSYKRILEPVNFIKGDWIRPEDVHYYEDIGIDEFKLVDRNMPTENISLIISAYAQRKYDGNLLDLFPSPKKTLISKSFGLMHKLKFFFRPLSVNIFKLAAVKDLRFDIFYIDNKALDGFIGHFFEHRCRVVNCQECGYCAQVGKNVISVDAKTRINKIRQYSEFINKLVSGEIFRCF